MISKTVQDLEFTPINDEEGLTGIICPECGKRIALLDIFAFDMKKGTNRDGSSLLVDHVDMTEDYECECGRSFRVYLDCKYAIGNITKSREQGKMQEETAVPLYETSESELKINLPER